MTNPDDDFEQHVRASLSQRAESSPVVDLADGALATAGRIRTRRRVSVGLAAAAVVALAVPFGASVLDDGRPDDNTATPPVTTTDDILIDPVKVTIAGLPTGAAPAVPYVSGDIFTAKDGETTTLVPTAGRVTDVSQFADGAGVWSLDTTDGNTRLTTNGSASNVPTGTESSNPAVDQASGETAWAASDVDANGQAADSDTIVVADELDGDFAAASAGDLNVQHVMGVSSRVVVFNAVDDGNLVVGRIDLGADTPTVEFPWVTAKTVTAIDPQFERLAARTSDMTGREKVCSAMLAYSDGAEEWRSCTWRPVEFSADGSLVLAVAPQDGLGPRDMAVLDAADGSIEQEFTTKGTFGRATFESSDVITVVVVDGQAAIVRCDLDGSCELATTPQEVRPDEPSSLQTPYQITAN